MNLNVNKITRKENNTIVFENIIPKVYIKSVVYVNHFNRIG